MKQIHAHSEMIKDRFYLAYTNRCSHNRNDRHVIIFNQNRLVASTLVSSQEYGYGNFRLGFHVEHMDTLANYNIYGGVFELTDKEVLRHIVMETI